MAILAFSSGNRNGARLIAAHSAFPAIVALWFAMLLGLGTLVLPTGLVERLVSGMDPPLGMAAQTLIALCAAAAGALAGFAAARRIAASLRMAGSRDESGIRPLSAHEELGDLLDWAEPAFHGHEPLAAWVEREPPRREDTSGSSDLAELVERLGQAIERHRAVAATAGRGPSAFAREPASSGYVSDDTEGALRSALERLRHLRGAA